MGKNVIISTLPNISQNYLPKVNTSNIFANSLVYDDGSSVLINTTTASAFRLDVNGTGRFQGALTGTSATFSGSLIVGTGTTGTQYFANASAEISYSATTGLWRFNNLAGGSAPTTYYQFAADGTPILSILKSGAATFSSSVTATQINIKDSTTDNPSTLALFEGAQTNRGLQIGLTTDSLGAVGSAVVYNARVGGGYGGHIWQNGGSTKMILNASGNVGIGTNSPGNKLAILDSDETTTPTLGTNAGKFGIFNGIGGGNYGIIMGVINNGNVYQQVQRIDGIAAAYNLLLQPSGGNVGIGTPSPTARLHLKAPSNDIVLRFEQQNDITSQYYFNIDSTINGALSLITNYLGGNVVGFSQNRSGNVGIGTASPSSYGSARLVVVNSAAAELARFTDGNNADIVLNTPSAGLATIDVEYGTAGALAIRTGTGKNERMRITSGGNVGIGYSNPTIVNITGTGQPLLQIANSSANGQLRVGGTDATGIGLVLDYTNAGTTTSTIRTLYATSNDGCALNIDSGYIAFRTGTSYTERMRITGGGSVVAGDTSATPTGTNNAAHLWIPSQNRMYISSTGSAATFSRASSGGTGTIMGFDYNGGAVGNISTNGSTITFSGTALSDERYKENIEVITNALDAINSVEWVSFNYKENNKKSAGVIAQQLKNTSLSDYVIDGIDNESYKAVDYNAIIGYLGKAIQELKSENDTLKADIESLKALINK